MRTQMLFAGLFLSVLLMACAPRARARGADSPESSIIRARSLGALSVGLEANQEFRRLYYDGGERADVRSLGGQVYMALEVFSWLTVNGGAGVADTVVSGRGVGHAARSAWSTGFELGLMQYDIFEPAFFESRATLHLLGAYIDQGLTDRSGVRPWEEYRVALLAGVERFAKKDFGADRHTSPYSLRLFIGPYYSEVDPDGFAKDQEIGGMAGVDIKLARGFSLGYAARARDFVSHTANIVLHF